jgi:hypothetical protein
MLRRPTILVRLLAKCDGSCSRRGNGASTSEVLGGGHHAGCGCAVGEQGEEVHIQPITGT